MREGKEQKQQTSHNKNSLFFSASSSFLFLMHTGTVSAELNWPQACLF